MKNNASSDRTPSPKQSDKSSPNGGSKQESPNSKPQMGSKVLKLSSKCNDTIVKQEEHYLARCTNFRLTTGYEVSICNCKHIRKIRIGERHSICNPQRWLCNICLTTDSVWACLSCPNVACGRFIKEHALTHFQESGHPLVIDVNELYVFCYKCDDYVLNDNNSSDIKVLRETLLAIRYQNFTGTTRSGHTLRSAMITEQEDVEMRRQMQQEQLDRDDRLFTAIWHSRFVRQRKTFRHWIRYIRWKRKQSVFSFEDNDDEEEEEDEEIMSDVDSSLNLPSDSVEISQPKDAATTSPAYLDTEWMKLPPSPKLVLDNNILDLAIIPGLETNPETAETYFNPRVSLPVLSKKIFTNEAVVLSSPTKCEECKIDDSLRAQSTSSDFQTTPQNLKKDITLLIESTDLVEEPESPSSLCESATANVEDAKPDVLESLEGDVQEGEDDVSSSESDSSEEVAPVLLNILSRPKRSNAAGRYKEIFSNLIGSRVGKREAAFSLPKDEPPAKKRYKLAPPPSGRRSHRIAKNAKDKEKKLTAIRGQKKKSGPRLTRRKYERKYRRPAPKKNTKTAKSSKGRKSRESTQSFGQKPTRARRLISGVAQQRITFNSYRPPSLYDNIPNKAVTSLIPGVTGLRNLGNTCYLNSIIQVLGHLQKFRLCLLALREIEFREALATSSKKNEAFVFSTPQARPVRAMTRRSTIDLYNEQIKPTTLSIRGTDRLRSGLNGGRSPCDTVSDSLPMSPTKRNHKSPSSVNGADNWSSSLSLCNELDHLYQVMWSGKWKLVSPYHFLHSVWSLIPSFRGYTQQDAQEFLCELLDKIVSELERCHSGSKQENKLTSRILEVLQKVFEGRLMSRVRCLECGHISSTVEPFWDLSLEFPERYHKITSKRRSSTCSKTPSVPVEPCTLHEMLQNFTAPETLDGGRVYGCTKCNFLQQNKGPAQKKKTLYRRNSQLLTEAEKQLKVLELPQVLRFHLKRFRWIGRTHREKITVHVEFPSELDMRPYCWNNENESANESQYMYDLSAVVIHHGRGFGSGHYTANCWNDIGEFWVHCNDSNLELRSIDDVKTSEAYILFYTQRGLDPSPHILSPPPTPKMSSPTHASPTLSETLEESEFELKPTEETITDPANSHQEVTPT